jgi:parallel beta-helix repeat protein
MNRKNRIRKTLMLFPLFLSLLILPEIVPAVSLSTSAHPAPVTPELRSIASCGGISYQSIQDAINHAPQNGTVIITPGTYAEVLVINKSLTLIGDTPDKILLAPTSAENSYAIKITAEGVTLANFSICNLAKGLYTVGIKIMGAHTTITNCVIYDTPIGIAIWSCYTMIAHCTFHNCSDEGIALLGSSTSACSNTHITACVFSENEDGIELQRSSDNLISDCRFLNNTHAGIDMIESANTKNSVTGCRFIANQGFGMYCAGASGLQVTDCTFSSDSIMLVNTKGSIISGSDISGLQLLRNTTVILDRCDTVDASRISTQTSQYLLLSSPSQIMPSNRHPLRGIVLALTSRLQILRLLATHLTQLRM